MSSVPTIIRLTPWEVPKALSQGTLRSLTRDIGLSYLRTKLYVDGTSRSGVRGTGLLATHVTLSGTGIGGVAAADIVTGGLIIAGTVVGDRHHPDLGGNNAVTTAFLAGFIAATSQTHGWNNEVLPLLSYTMLNVTAQTWELTLPPVLNYVIDTSEIVTFTQPASSLVASSLPIVASPTIGVSPTLVFSSDWGTGTGQTDAVLRDTSSATPWTEDTGIVTKNSAVVTALSLGLVKWPTTNVFRVSSYGTAITAQSLQLDLGAPSNGTQRYFRVYMQVPWADAHGASTQGNWEHGMETADALIGGGDGFVFVRIPQNNGTWWPVWGDIGDATKRYTAWNLALSKTATYRLEWHITYGTSTYTVEVRIYDEDGVLVATDADFWRFRPSENAGLLLGAETWNYIAGDHRYFRIGTNGPTSNFPLTNISDDDPLFYYGAVAVSETDWCGAY